ncbi:MAG: type VI secretion system baseplate subunit TssE [Acetobacteraceae bacterium]
MVSPAPLRARLPLLDRLLDEAPGQAADAPLSPSEAMATLRASVRRDLEALLNSRRRWQSWPAHLEELPLSAVGYGLPDFTAGALNDPARREWLRREIEATIRRFEPRLTALHVAALDSHNALEPRLRLRIEALLHAEPAEEPVTFETLVDATTAEVILREGGARADV